MIEFFVPGVPRPQGSKRAMLSKSTGKPMLKEMSADLHQWRAAIAFYARKQYDDKLLIPCPVSLTLTFFFTRPKGHYGTGRNAGKIKDTAPNYPTKPPDTDKLIRAVCDSLTGVIWVDDSLVVAINAEKHWAAKPGVQITVETRQTWGPAL